ncbi:MAG: DinB family protein [Lacibacter sp.]
MISLIKESLWKQSGASMDMLKHAIELFPEDDGDFYKKLFYNAYHCLLFLDYYLCFPPESFVSPLPFTIAAPTDDKGGAVDDLIPDRIYTKQELLDYLQQSREKCRLLIAGLTEEAIHTRWIEKGSGRNFGITELLLYNMRHVQHHAAQLNLLLRQNLNKAPWWVSSAEDPL